MDSIAFVQKVKMLCLLRDMKPTNACIESGVGSSFLPDIKRGRVPSVEKVQMLASYLGVTTSELLGEEKEPTPVSEDGQNVNIIKIAGRDGSHIERKLTDEQMDALKRIIDQLPDADDL